MTNVSWEWPDGKRIAVAFNVCLEAWSAGKAPGISPMGNPLPSQVLDRMAISWASYGVNIGTQRLIRSMDRHGVHATVAVNGVIAEETPEVVKLVADNGHEVASHSYAMDAIPGLMSEEDERALIDNCTKLLTEAAGIPVRGWLSPRATPSASSSRLLAEANYTWHGDTLATDLPYVERHGDREIVAIPLNTDVNDMPFMKHGNPPSFMLDAFIQNLEAARAEEETTIIDVTTHAHIFGRPRGAFFHEKIVELAASSTDIWVATRAEIAEHTPEFRS